MRICYLVTFDEDVSIDIKIVLCTVYGGRASCAIRLCCADVRRR